MGKGEAEAAAQAIANCFAGTEVGDPRQPCAVASTKTFKLKLRYLDTSGKPREGVAYKLVVGAQIFEGATDAAGFFEHELPGGSTIADLTYDHELTFRLHIGKMATPNSPAGAQPRLSNLGFGSGDAVKGMLDLSTRDALLRLQHLAELAETSVCDGPTSAELTYRYGC